MKIILICCPFYLFIEIVLSLTPIKHTDWLLSLFQVQSGTDGGRRLPVTFRADSEFLLNSVKFDNLVFPGVETSFTQDSSTIQSIIVFGMKLNQLNLK